VATKKAVVIGVLLAGLAGLAALGGVGGLVYVAVQGLWSWEPTSAEKELLVHVSRLEAYGQPARGPGPAESYRAQRNLDGSFSAEYEYDSDKDPASPQFLFLKSEAEVNRGLRQARESFSLTIGAYKVGVKLVKGRLIEPSNEPLGLGAESYHALIRQNGKPIGNVAVVRQGKAVHSLLLLGLYFEDARDLADLLRPGLETSAAMEKR
jgi:hypothetical protein